MQIIEALLNRKRFKNNIKNGFNIEKGNKAYSFLLDDYNTHVYSFYRALIFKSYVR